MKKNFNRGNRRNGQKAQGARKANYQTRQQGADNSLSRNQGANQQVAAAPATSSRHHIVDFFQTIAKLVRNMFDRLPRVLQNLETKQACISAAVARHYEKVGDLGDFYGWLMKRAEEIRHAWDFKSVCEANGLNSDEEQQAVSEHLVLEPKSVINKIRMEGLATFQGNIKMYRERLVPVEYRYEKPAAEAKEGGDE